ncbi:MAG: LemA family protein [Candidatus Gribaldobacteria bacterium]|nr:LemA family protein [Candidatus Gribaldobacteria bacterium]
MLILYIVLAVVAIVIAWFVGSYNGFVRLKNRAKEAWSDIEVQLKRRYDLIPNLVQIVKGYAAHESQVFEKVTQARSQAISAQTVPEKTQAENALSATLKSLFAVSEAYPELKASVNFLDLQRELTDTEDKIQAARRFYNGNARDMSIKLESFPSSIIGKIGNFKPFELFELDEPAAKEAPKIQF